PGVDDIVLHQRQKVGATGQHFSLPPGCTQEAHGLFFRSRTRVFEGSHYAPAFCANAPSTRSGVRGKNGTRTPIALATALEIAAPGEITGGSPKPMTPRSSYPLPVIICTLNSPMSIAPASL